MTNNLIVAVTVNLQFQQLRMFVESAVQNANSKILLISAGLTDQSQHYLRQFRRVQVQSFNYSNPVKFLVVDRFFIIASVLGKLLFENILLSDARDVFFQADPFSEVEEPLTVFKEPVLIGNCATNSNWINLYYGADCAGRLAGYPVICAGTILGHRKLIMPFLKQFCDMMLANRSLSGTSLWGLDQCSLNKLVHENQHSFALKFTGNEDGLGATLHHEKKFNVDADGRLLTDAGHLIRLVHQYDRFPWLDRHFRGQIAI